MKKLCRNSLWQCIDLFAWVLSLFKNPEANIKARSTPARLRKPAGYVYRPIAEINRRTLPSGQMVLPGIGISDDWK